MATMWAMSSAGIHELLRDTALNHGDLIIRLALVLGGWLGLTLGRCV